MIVGCYDLHLYCEKFDHGGLVKFPWEYTSETAAECYQLARKDGWKIDLTNRKAYCPECAKERK